MIVGTVREIKDSEHRVAITPESSACFVSAGHSVLIQRGAGEGSGCSDNAYRNAGAEIVSSAADVFGRADLIVKIKEPLPPEYALCRRGQILFTFFHFASSLELTRAMMECGAVCVAYETVQTAAGATPLLAPMSEIAGKMAPLVAANCLSRPAGGKGVLASAVGNVPPARFLILGGGTAGRASAAVAVGIGADVCIIEKNSDTAGKLERAFPAALIAPPQQDSIAEQIQKADAVIGTIHVPGSRSPRLVTADMVASMEAGSVIVDISVDQGGCCETTRPTTHSDPVFIEHGVIHYCVANMPGIFPRTATLALTGATLPYALELANKGEAAFAREDLLKGLNIIRGRIVNRGVAEAHGLAWQEPAGMLAV